MPTTARRPRGPGRTGSRSAAGSRCAGVPSPNTSLPDGSCSRERRGVEHRATQRRRPCTPSRKTSTSHVDPTSNVRLRIEQHAARPPPGTGRSARRRTPSTPRTRDRSSRRARRARRRATPRAYISQRDRPGELVGPAPLRGTAASSAREHERHHAPHSGKTHMASQDTDLAGASGARSPAGLPWTAMPSPGSSSPPRPSSPGRWHETFQLVAEAGYAGARGHGHEGPREPGPRPHARARAAARPDDRGDPRAVLLLTRKVWGTDPIGKIDRSIEVAERRGDPARGRCTRRTAGSVATGAGWTRRLPDACEQRTGVTRRDREHVPGADGRPRACTFHANQDLEELEGLPHLVLDTSHAAVAEHDPGRGAPPVRRPDPPRAPVGQRGQGMGLPPPAGRGRPSARGVPGRPGRERLRGSDLAGGRPPALADRRRRIAGDHGRDAGSRGAPARGTGPSARSRASTAASLHDVRRPTFIMLIVLFVR